MLREAVGDDTELMFDVYSGWDLTYALEWAKQVEQYRPRWIEEATQAEKIDSFAALQQGHLDSDRVGRAHSGPLGSLRLSEGGRAQRGAVRSGMVRRHLGAAEDLHGGFDSTTCR